MRYIQDPRTLELVDAAAYVGDAVDPGYYVLPDIAPYRSMIDGSVVGSRSRHREHLRAHGCIEVGNEVQAPRPMRHDHTLRHDLLEAYEHHRR